MNIYGSSEQELSNRRRKQKQYRDTLEQQIKEKQRLKQSQLRLRTEQPRGSHNSPRINTRESNTNHSSITRKNNYQSNFLPSIDTNYRKKSFINGHQRAVSYGQDHSRIMQQDTDIQTIQALAQCDIIIENLRRLRLKSLSSMKKKQMNYKLNMEGSPSSFDKYTQRNSNYPRQKQSLAQQQVMMFRAWQPGQKYKSRRDRNNNQSLKNKQKIKLNEQEDERDSSLEDQSLIPNTIQFQYNGSNGESGDFQGSVDKGLDGEEEGLQSVKNKEQRQKASKRQKFLLKYLGRAKMRGAKLQEKIVNFRNRTINIPEGRVRSEEQDQIEQSRNILEKNENENENEFEGVGEGEWKSEQQNSKSVQGKNK